MKNKYSKDDLGNRMKEYYEGISKTKLTRRTPVAIRLDGKAFQTFTKGFKKPFDVMLRKTMEQTVWHLCKSIQGCVFGYTQSDEITLILIDYQKLNTDAWFGYEVQKMCSVSASMATLFFNQIFSCNTIMCENVEKFTVYMNAKDRGAMFDARCFNIPKEEVTNLIYWRQLDAIRNSVQAVGQANFPHRELQGLGSTDIKQKLKEEKGIDWEMLPTVYKLGSCCYRKEDRWFTDFEMPLLMGENRKLLDDLVMF